jgi:hypothetical protein
MNSDSLPLQQVTNEPWLSNVTGTQGSISLGKLMPTLFVDRRVMVENAEEISNPFSTHYVESDAYFSVLLNAYRFP